MARIKLAMPRTQQMAKVWRDVTKMDAVPLQIVCLPQTRVLAKDLYDLQSHLFDKAKVCRECGMFGSIVPTYLHNRICTM